MNVGHLLKYIEIYEKSMCGISGVIFSDKLSADVQNSILRRMNSAMIHRGPDGEGEFVANNIALAMRRLSIIDLAGGWQPLYNEDRTLVMVCNGEIYNHIELRQSLIALGHRFSTHSDSEVILHLYEEYGADCVSHLRGMFVFALWDMLRRKIIIARDRMGEKPLYLHQQGDRLLFASELKALLSSGEVEFELDPVSIDQYFHYGYVPEPRTPLRGVRKLAAGHMITIDVECWSFDEKCYWRMEDSPPLEGNPAELIREQLDLISSQIIRSDVPVGVALSAGLDSSAIAALAARHYPGTMQAFSVGYPGRPRNDERAGAKAFSNYLGVPLYEVEVSVTDMVEFFPELNYWRDDPIADISGYGYYAVMKSAREHGVPVMLQGQGGDELFWGYHWLRKSIQQTLLKSQMLEHGKTVWPKILASNLIQPTGVRSLIYALRNGFGIGDGLKAYNDFKKGDQDSMIMFDLTPDYSMAARSARNLYTDKFINELADSNPASIFTHKHPWPDIGVELTRIICQTYLLENGLAQGDRLSMMSSVELRLPLVDSRLVETVIGLRKTQPDHSLGQKYWFKEAMKDIVPDWVMNRPKQGFAPPVRDWYKALFAAYGSQLQDGCLVSAGVITPEAGRILATGPVPRGAIMPLSFKALVLESWCRGLSDIKSAV
jgi:asparagine synthase (glutamine-hydrolysing)